MLGDAATATFRVHELCKDSSEILFCRRHAELHAEHEAEFDLALHTGMSRGEQYRLRWQDIDLKRGIITDSASAETA